MNLFLSKISSNITLFIIFIEIKSAFTSFKKITKCKEEKVYYDKDNPREFYYYQNTKYQQEVNYDIIKQIKDLLIIFFIS